MYSAPAQAHIYRPTGRQMAGRVGPTCTFRDWESADTGRPAETACPLLLALFGSASGVSSSWPACRSRLPCPPSSPHPTLPFRRPSSAFNANLTTSPTACPRLNKSDTTCIKCEREADGKAGRHPTGGRYLAFSFADLGGQHAKGCQRSLHLHHPLPPPLNPAASNRAHRRKALRGMPLSNVGRQMCGTGYQS